MAGRVDVKVNVDHLRQIVRKLKNPENELHGPEWRKAVEDAADAALSAAKSRAPRGATGQLYGQLQTKLDARPVPAWAIVKTTARAKPSKKYRAGYAYPRRLEWDPRSRHKGWMLGAIKSIGGKVEGMLNMVADRINARWLR